MPFISERWASNKPRSRHPKKIELDEQIATSMSRAGALNPDGDVSIGLFKKCTPDGELHSLHLTLSPGEALDLGQRLINAHAWIVVEPAWDEALAENAARALAIEIDRAWDEAKVHDAMLPRGTLAMAPNLSWAPEVIADSSGKWCGNALRFATKEEAEANVADLFIRWTLVRETRVVESPDPVNYQWSIVRGLVSCRKGA